MPASKTRDANRSHLNVPQTGKRCNQDSYLKNSYPFTLDNPLTLSIPEATSDEILLVSVLSSSGSEVSVDKTSCRIMKTLSKCVRPIISEYGWCVVHLQEFYPRKNSHLLGLNKNKGEEISIRLRHPDDFSHFLPFESILCTLLHELTHCQIQRHGLGFNKLYQKLVDKCEKHNLEHVLFSSQFLENHEFFPS